MIIKKREISKIVDYKLKEIKDENKTKNSWLYPLIGVLFIVCSVALYMLLLTRK